MTLLRDNSELHVTGQVLTGEHDLPASRLRLEPPCAFASRSMSLVRRLLMVLLLAGPGGVLAWEDWYYERNPCGHYCGGGRNVQCADGCKCVLEDYENWGVCRRVPQCGGH
nr:uncharacterized protein LOC129383543 [Dermacentor andersoni]